MWSLFSLIFLTLAVSLDSFGAGITYGLRKIRLPLLSVIIIGCCSGAMIVLSMYTGQWLAQWIAPGTAEKAGGTLLCLLGIWGLIQAGRNTVSSSLRKEDALREETVAPARLLSLEIRRLGLVIQILKTPAVADIDRSGTISPGEAVWLGTALSLDAFGAGVGAALMGHSPWTAAGMIVCACAVFLIAGIKLGFCFVRRDPAGMLSYLPGLLLLILGLTRFF
ncbi:sporulation membrane protein YtaF [Marinithermofilum abyssi]|uniref:Sporulation membrane protein YtaF n=1 Tax=Marinithermofilum abyssi TaxID=1571185 RepID=A0A8J2YE38_9BACL|nr:sporulation membrane protein YtaF [Marinithermofilum abyssi]GGE17546.1 sporulation membrane protein YtaF [Marinithermofilum abyssi]